MEMDDKLYHYRGKVLSIYDADTIRVDIDLGMNLSLMNQSMRFNRINAPEVRGESREEGLKARDYLRERIDQKKVLIQTEKDEKEKYGRYLAEVWLKENGTYVNINDELVKKGFAVYKTY